MSRHNMPEEEPPKDNKRLKRINFALVALIVLINGYILLSPLWPQVQLWWRKHHEAAVAGIPYKTKLDTSSDAAGKRSAPPSENRLVIPKLALNQQIYTGDSPYLVNKGVWVIPKTSTPPNMSNTVMAAHRFTYDGPSIFYSLDKMAKGDKILVYWQKKEYDYTVSDVKVVPPMATYVENHTDNPQITLFTCTPLWSAKDRLVVVAKLDKGQQT